LVTGISNNGDVVAIYSHIHFFDVAGNNQILEAPRAALIDVASGRLMAPPRKPNGANRSNYWPDNNSDNCHVLPYWDIVLRHTKVAHQACSNYVFIGWDVALTDQGPMLLEGNLNWTASDYQRLGGEPLGRTKFAEVLATQLYE
jgi:hypothetical protein